VAFCDGTDADGAVGGVVCGGGVLVQSDASDAVYYATASPRARFATSSGGGGGGGGGGGDFNDDDGASGEGKTTVQYASAAAARARHRRLVKQRQLHNPRHVATFVADIVTVVGLASQQLLDARAFWKGAAAAFFQRNSELTS
jgi:hypothetical protein